MSDTWINAAFWIVMLACWGLIAYAAWDIRRALRHRAAPRKGLQPCVR